MGDTDQAVVEQTSSDEGPLDSLDDAPEVEIPSSEVAVEDTGTTGDEDPKVGTDEADKVSEEQAAAEETPEQAKAETEQLRQRVKELEEGETKHTDAYRKLQSQSDQREREVLPMLEGQRDKLDDLAKNDQYWEERATEIGFTQASNERSDVLVERAKVGERIAADEQRVQERDTGVRDGIKKKFLDAGKTNEEFAAFMEERGNFNKVYSYKDAHALVDNHLNGEHAHKISAEAQENQARTIETNVRKKVAESGPKAGTSASTSKAAKGSPESAMEGIEAAAVNAAVSGAEHIL